MAIFITHLLYKSKKKKKQKEKNPLTKSIGYSRNLPFVDTKTGLKTTAESLQSDIDQIHQVLRGSSYYKLLLIQKLMQHFLLMCMKSNQHLLNPVILNDLPTKLT